MAAPLGLELLDVVLEELEAAHVADVKLERFAPWGGSSRYVARSRTRRAHVDRALAVRLRAGGAVWCGDVADDPCAVA